ncbi:histidine kinase [Parasphingorhabdus pacifica]
MLSWWDGKIRSLLFDLAVAVITARAGVDLDDLTPLSTCLLIAAGLGLLVRRRFPWAALVMSVPALFISSVGITGWVAIYTMARRKGPCTQLWVATAITLVMSILGAYHTLSPGEIVIAVVILSAVFLTGLPVLLGLWVFQRKMLLVSYQERAEQAERERDLLAERAVVAERRRIAREMHDVVAHRVSVISLQAGALTMNAQEKRTVEVAEVIRTTSSTALNELRTMLRVLRDDESDSTQDGGGELANTPTVGSIASLVREAVDSGAHVRLEMPDPPPETSAEVGRAAYRVAQEALTNAAKHAPHAAVLVAVHVQDDELVVTVSNQRGRSTDTDAVPGSGYGLIGMRERVTLAGGTLHTGLAEDGGYRVRASFPRNTDEAMTT